MAFFSRRFVSARFFRRDEKPGGVRRVLIVGAGDTGEAVARLMRRAPVQAYEPVAFTDDDPVKRGRRIHGIPVAGATSDIPRVIEEFTVDEVLVAIAKVRPRKTPRDRLAVRPRARWIQDDAVGR